MFFLSLRNLREGDAIAVQNVKSSEPVRGIILHKKIGRCLKSYVEKDIDGMIVAINDIGSN